MAEIFPINVKHYIINQSIRRESVVDDHVKGLHFLSLCSLSNKKVSLSCHNCEDLDFSIFNVLTPSSIIAFTTRKGYLKQFHCIIKDDIFCKAHPTWLYLQNINEGILVINLMKECILFASPVVEISQSKYL